MSNSGRRFFCLLLTCVLLLPFGGVGMQLLPLEEKEYPRLYYRYLFDQLKALNRDSIVSVLQEEIEREEKKHHHVNTANLKIIAGKLIKGAAPARGFIEIQGGLFYAQKHGLLYEQSIAHVEMGDIYQSKGQRERALEHYLSAAEIAERATEFELAFRAYYHVGNLHYQSDNFPEALKALNKGLEFFTLDEWLEKERVVNHDVMSAFNTKGLSHFQLQEYDSAIQNYLKALRVAGERKDDFWIGLIHGNVGAVLIRQNKLDSAEALLNLDLRSGKKHGAYQSVANTYLDLAEIHKKEGDFRLAMTYFDSAYAIIDRMHLSQPSYYRRRAQLAYEVGNYKEAFDLKSVYDQQLDSLEKLKKSKELLLINANFEFQSRLESLQLLEKENQLKDEELKYKNLFIYGSAFVILLTLALLVVTFRSNRLKVKLNRELEKEVSKRTRKLARTIKELDTFIYRLSHDFRRPLTTLIGLDALGRTINKDPETNELFSKVALTARQMDRMLLKMTYIHEINSLKPRLTEVDLSEMVREVSASLQKEISGVYIQQEIAEGTMVKTDARFLELILNNLVENSLVFADQRKEQRRVTISFTRNDKRWELHVADNGDGIPHSIRDQIFEPFFRGSPASQGNGLGLYLIRKAVKRLKGEITLQSEPGLGTTFVVGFNISAGPAFRNIA